MHPFIRPNINLEYSTDHPDGVSSLPQLIQFNAIHNGDHLFGLQSRTKEDTEPRKITFSQLHEAVKTSSAWLVNAGATSGRIKREQSVKPVAILLGSDIGIYIYMAALLRIGTPVLCLSARLTPLAIAHLLQAVNPSTILVSTQLSQAAEKALDLLKSQYSCTERPNVLVALHYDEFLPDSVSDGLKEVDIPPAYNKFEPSDVDACIFHSSGTTGLPKPIYHSQTYPLIYAACHRMPERDVTFSMNVSTLPLYHGFGLLAPSLSLSIGMPFYLFPATVIPTARSVLSALKSTDARYMFSVPSILEDILNLAGSDGLAALQRLEILAIGGAPIKESVGDELVSNGVQLLNHWGATEIGAIAPIQPVPTGYDRHYLIPRTDIGLEFIETEGKGSLTRQLIGHPPGWNRPFVVQDLLEANPADVTQVKILGRADDLIVLATGEKIRPASLERVVAEHPRVKAVLAFGDRQFSMGLIVELWDAEDSDLRDQVAVDAVLDSIAPYLDRGNSFVDNHGKVVKEMLVLTTESMKPLIRTDKGSLARKANCELFSSEIDQCYSRAVSLKSTPFPSPSDSEALLRRTREIVADATEQEIFRSQSGDLDTADFFEMGVDSLQAKRIHAVVLGSLKATPGLPKPVEKLELDFVFQHPSVKKLNDAIMELISGTGTEVQGKLSESGVRVRAMEAMVEKYRDYLNTLTAIAGAAHKTRRENISVKNPGSVVLLTGSTGSLGCMLLARFAADPNVSKIICINRLRKRQTEDIRERQEIALERRGTCIARKNWNKVVLHESDVHSPNFGLTSEAYEELLEVTHIVHNAWPVDFNMKLSSFESHIKLVAKLALLCIESSARRPCTTPPTRLLFLSSIAVVGRYPLLHPQGPYEVPEEALEAENTAEMGYAEAKWVAERVVLAAGEMYGGLIQTSNIRIGQLTGAEGRGAWNESEHFPLIVRTSRYLKLLPYLQGSLSWLPVNRAADIVAELLFSTGFKSFYHVENPSRQSWSGLLRNLSLILGNGDKTSSPVPLVPFSEWLEQVKKLGDDPRNKAMKIFDFLEHHFVRMASGPVILRTTNAREDSPSMVRSTSLDMGHLEEYVEYWKTTEQV
ncbi:acetyl-CoA synthetase-like protein [Dendrothele bispora CBS 962.96]|uniref:Acetyl-CoA synthetase-like protein n=1 Tax=Dendrothele bispora (strain CBS 962.96) TaxID=1314807 RepID=A0A4S8M4M1_DENBC|nr:acetyl-CoA synthetase-like protein [Dendrothele bispora CBS 962.96]